MNNSLCLFLLFFIIALAFPVAVFAQDPSSAGLDCDPLPVDDMEKLNECVFWIGIQPKNQPATPQGEQDTYYDPSTLDCNPLPVDDMNKLNECVFWMGVNSDFALKSMQSASPDQGQSSDGSEDKTTDSQLTCDPVPTDSEMLEKCKQAGLVDDSVSLDSNATVGNQSKSSAQSSNQNGGQESGQVPVQAQSLLMPILAIAGIIIIGVVGFLIYRKRRAV
jgi:hypothetical protein